MTTPDTRAALITAAVAELTEGGRADISLRAVARRAGVSHAAPGYVFGDRAGLLTAVAADGFRELTHRLRDAAGTGSGSVAGYGRVYVDFALERPAVFDLMFGPHSLHENEENLAVARTAALGALDAATRTASAEAAADPSPIAVATLTSWALAHGVAVLLRTGALQAAVGGSVDATTLADTLVDAYVSGRFAS